MKIILLLTIILLSAACQQKPADKTASNGYDSSGVNIAPPTPTWVDSGKVSLALDSSKSQDQLYELGDSVILVHYKGTHGEVEFELINGEGKWLDSIYAVEKLTQNQLKKFKKVFTDVDLRSYDPVYCCYDPRYGIVFFNDGKVIGVTSFSVKNSKVNSTGVLNNGKHYAAFDSSLNSVLIQTIKESQIVIER